MAGKFYKNFSGDRFRSVYNLLDSNRGGTLEIKERTFRFWEIIKRKEKKNYRIVGFSKLSGNYTSKWRFEERSNFETKISIIVYELSFGVD